MSDYPRQIGQIKAAQTLDELRDIARSFPVQAHGEGGILYSGRVGNVPSEVIAKELARKTGLSIINDTPRAQFLSNGDVENAIRDSAERILVKQGMPLDEIEKARSNFLYGDGKAPPESPFSVKNSLWGEASGEFAGSLRGHVVVVASAANAERVLAQVEVVRILHVNQAVSLGGHALSELQTSYAQGGMQTVLPNVQTSFIDASAKGIFIDPGLVDKPVTQVAVSREVAIRLNLDGSKFVGVKALAEAGFVPAPLTPLAPASVVPRILESGFAQERAAVRGGASAEIAMRGATALGAAAIAYDATTTATHTADLLHQGNSLGAQSQVEHFAGRAGGGWAGAVAGAEVGGALGGLPGGVVGGILGGGIGAFGGEKIADAYDNHKIYAQTDPHGQTWRYDPEQPLQGWTRDLPPLPDTPHGQHIQADPALSDRLNYQASSTAVELQLARPFTPADPYTQPAGPHDTPSQIDAPWTRDAQTKQWSRTVTDQVMEHGLKSTHAEVATPQRAGQLDVAAQNTIADNLAHSQRDMAERYQAAYQHYGWHQHGPMPAAVADALRAPANTVQASDGHTYTRTADGEWTTPGRVFGTNAAEGNVRDELDATRLAGNANVAAASGEAAAAPHTPMANLSRSMSQPGLGDHARAQAAMHGGDAAARRQAAKTLSDAVLRDADGHRAFDSQRHREAGQIPVAPSHATEPETISPRSLTPVQRATHPDRAHEQQLLRDVALINERTERELGKAPLHQREVPELTRARTQERIVPDQVMQRTAPAEAIQPDHPAKRVDEAKREAAMAAPTASAPALPVQPAPVPVMRAVEPNHGVSPAADAPPPAPAMPTQIPEPHHSAGLTPPRQPEPVSPEPEAGHLRESMAAPRPVHTSPFAENDPMAFRVEAHRDEHRHDPNHPAHPDYAMHQGIRDHLVALHRDAGFALAPDQMERLTASVLVEAKRSGLTDVTHMEFGEAVASGKGTPTIHVFQAFRGDLDDPRTEWGAVNAQQAMDAPLQHSHQQLQVVNQQLEQQHQYNQQWRVQEQQQQSVGPTMTV